jgi:hypothetical protein
VYNRTVKAAKKLFYDSQFKINQANIKKLWELMFEVIKKTKSKTNDISSILADNVSFSDPKMIAEKFNEFFTGVAQKIADEIPLLLCLMTFLIPLLTNQFLNLSPRL